MMADLSLIKLNLNCNVGTKGSNLVKVGVTYRQLRVVLND